ncbi:hypothetical protein P7D93_19215, partial [Enterococcus raffinosus]|nr:hypothetical protein [Enterococcus raffinosus]
MKLNQITTIEQYLCYFDQRIKVKKESGELQYPLIDDFYTHWICVNKVDSFFESFFETNPLSSCFM